MAIRKTIYFDEKEYEKLQDMKLKYGLKSDSEAISFLLQSESLTDDIAKSVVKEFEESYMKSERLKWATKTAEQNSIVILDAIDTLLHMFKADALISAELAPNVVVEQSQKNIKDKIAYFKQKSDERKRKQSDNSGK